VSGGWESGWASTQLQLAPVKAWWAVVGNPAKSLAKSLKSEQAGRKKKSQCGLRPLKMEIHLPSLPMLKILSYLDAYNLLQAAQVNKVNALWLNSSIWCTLHEALWLFPLSLGVSATPASHSHSLSSSLFPSLNPSLASFPFSVNLCYSDLSIQLWHVSVSGTQLLLLTYRSANL
jgi:F-box/WD-40 domain protein 12/13/14/15/16/17/19